MRISIMAWVLFAAACGTDTGDKPAFSVVSSDVTIAPGEEVTKCFYFHTTNTKPIAVNRWVSDMTPGSHHMIFYAGGPDHEDGPSIDDCAFALEKGLNQPSWVFASQIAHADQELPADDGTGKPLAQVIQPHSLGAFQMHYLNSSDAPLVAHATLEAYALAESAVFTETAPYVTYHTEISIPPGAIGTQAKASCQAPAGKFWQITTHAHKQAVATEVKDGDTMMFQSTDWEHPGRTRWDADPFFTVQSGKVAWSCTYNNTTQPNAGMTIVDGASAATNEMCMAVGYSFPANGPTLCLASNEGCFCPINDGTARLPGN